MQTLFTLPARDWYKFPKDNVPGIYGVTGLRQRAIYIGKAIRPWWRVAEHFCCWSQSDIWYKCTTPHHLSAWAELIERWQVGLLASVDGGSLELAGCEKRFIAQYQPLFNCAGKEVLERRYDYLQLTGIEGIYRDHDERLAFETKYPELFKEFSS